MDRTEFESEVSADGYREVVDRQMQANSVNPEHAHDFDARLLIIEGEMTVASGGEEWTYRSGDTFAMAAGCRHAERSGPAGVRYLAGRRYQQRSNG